MNPIVWAADLDPLLIVWANVTRSELPGGTLYPTRHRMWPLAVLTLCWSRIENLLTLVKSIG